MMEMSGRMSDLLLDMDQLGREIDREGVRETLLKESMNNSDSSG